MGIRKSESKKSEAKNKILKKWVQNHTLHFSRWPRMKTKSSKSQKCQKPWRNISQKRKLLKFWLDNTIKHLDFEKCNEKSQNWSIQNVSSQNTRSVTQPN